MIQESGIQEVTGAYKKCIQSKLCKFKMKVIKRRYMQREWQLSALETGENLTG